MHTLQGVAEPAQIQTTPGENLLDAETPYKMYPREFNLDGTTKHSRHCGMAFGRYDWDCHRCIELINNAAPRKGWQQEYFARKLAQVQRRLPW
jgi:hypothetical protein